MTKILSITSSIFEDGGQSTQLSQKFIQDYQARNLGTEVVNRNLQESGIPHITAEIFQSFSKPAEDLTAEEKKNVDLSDSFIEELKEADIVVLGLPMYNFGVPSTLKAWIDHVARAGQTFRYTENGPEGLLKGKKAYVFAARGGNYLNTEKDSQTPYIKTFLEFIGIDDIEFVFAEGLALGDGPRTEALAAASEKIRVMAAA